MSTVCFDVEAKIERQSIVSSYTLKHASLCGDANDGDHGKFDNYKLTPGSSEEMRFKFGDGGKTTHDVSVRDVKAIFGKFVREGKLTIESRDGVKILIKGAPAECARLMKTLTSLKSLPLNARDAYLRELEPCTRCKDKCQANAKKVEEKERKVAEAQIAANELSAEKKRKREAEEFEKHAGKESKLAEQLRDLEEKRDQIERKKSEIAQLKIDILGERATLTEEKESVVQLRRELADERRWLEREKGTLQEEREKLQEERKKLQQARELLDAENQHIKEHEARNDSRRSEAVDEEIRLSVLITKLTNMKQDYESEHFHFEQTKAKFDREKAHEGPEEAAARKVRDEASRRAKMREEARTDFEKSFKETSPGSFYGKKKAKIVMDDDESDGEATDANKENEEQRAKEETEFMNDEESRRRTLERIEKLRKEELERQLREKLVQEELARKQKAAEQKKNQTKKAAMESKAARERMFQQEVEFREHLRRQSEQAKRIQEKARSTSVPTATRQMWESHLAALDRLMCHSEGSLGENDIPWPPAHNIAFFAQADDLNEKKKKVTKATLSWHPDKFEAKFGRLLKASAAAKIRERVRELSSQYIELRQVLASTN